MTGGQFLRFLAQYRGMRSFARAKELAEYFELDAGAKLKKMSKGTKQKVAIVCAFMHDPQLYVLDEPTGGLDPLMQSRFVELLQEEQKKGKTILLSSHIFEEVEKTCTRTAIIRAGHIAAVKDMQALSHSRRKYFTVRFETPAMAAQFAAEFAGAGVQGAHVTLPVAASQADAVIKRLRHTRWRIFLCVHRRWKNCLCIFTGVRKSESGSISPQPSRPCEAGHCLSGCNEPVWRYDYCNVRPQAR